MPALAFLALGLLALSGFDDDGDTPAIVRSNTPLAAVDTLLAAIEAKDGDAYEAVFLDKATITVIEIAADGTRSVSRQRAEKAGAQVAAAEGALRETYRDPVIHHDGAVAALWTPYTFSVDGKVSHCGNNAFLLAYTEDGWKISDLSYTVSRRCREDGFPKP